MYLDGNYGPGDLCKGLGSTPEEALAAFDTALGKIFEEYGILPEEPLNLGVKAAQEVDHTEEPGILNVLAGYIAMMEYRLYILEGKSEAYALEQAFSAAIHVQETEFWKELESKGFTKRDLTEKEREKVKEITASLTGGF